MVTVLEWPYTTDGLGRDGELASCVDRQLENHKSFLAPVGVAEAEVGALYGGHTGASKFEGVH